MSKSIIGTFENWNAAETALNGLLAQGYSENDISVLVSDESRGKHFQVGDESRGKHFQIDSDDKTGEGIGTGAVVGGAIGALVAGLTAVGAIASGGALLAAGPMVAALSGAGAGGATGGLIGGLIGMGIPEHEAKLSTTDVEKGSILVGVSTDEDRVAKTKSLLKDSGARRVTTQ